MRVMIYFLLMVCLLLVIIYRLPDLFQ